MKKIEIGGRKYRYNKDDEGAIIRAAMECIAEKFEREPYSLTSPDAAKQYLALALSPEKSEVFGVMFLDTRHRVITFEKMFRGTIDGSSIHVREIVRRALEVNAAAIIVSHNHPSGDPTPSAQDKEVTKRIKRSLDLVDVRLLDHIVVGGLDSVSLAEMGVI